jgi:hypothetical protein
MNSKFGKEVAHFDRRESERKVIEAIEREANIGLVLLTEEERS